MANMYIVPGMPEVCTDNNGNQFYDISCMDYRVVDISDIYNYTGEVNSDGHALDFEGAQAYTSDHFSTETIETAFIAFVPGQKINYMTDVIALRYGGNTAFGFNILSKSFPELDGGNSSTIFDRPWLLASHNGFMGFIGTNYRGNPWDYEWNWVPFGNYSTQVGIGSFYPLEESEGVSVEYGWTDGGSGTLGLKEIRLYQGFSVAGAWRCAVNGVVSGAVTFEWYKDGKLISTQEKRTVSDCTPSADELGVFSYHCVVTHATGKTWETDPLTATVEVYNGGGGSGGGGDSSGGDEGGDDSGGDSVGGDDSGGDSGGDDPGGGGNEPTVSEAWVRSFKEGLALGLTGAPLPYTGKAEPVAYLYNGVRLPKLPEWDKEAYPYAVIQQYGGVFTDRYARLSCMENITAVTYKTDDESANEYYSDGVIYSDRITTKSTYDKSAEEYSDFGDFEAIEDGTFVPLRNTLWTNVDLYRPDGTLYLAATDPVPVYD